MRFQLAKNEGYLMIDVILVSIMKGNGDEKYSDVQFKNIDVEPVKIEQIPKVGCYFSVIKDGCLNKKFTFLRKYSDIEQACNYDKRVANYDHVIFAEVFENDEFPGGYQPIMGFSGAYPESVKKIDQEKLHEHFKKNENENFKKFIKLGKVEHLDGYGYFFIKAPCVGGVCGYKIFCFLMVEYVGDGKIIRSEIISFVVISNNGNVLLDRETHEEAIEEVRKLITKDEEDKKLIDDQPDSHPTM
jgi:hypothetical protein